MSAFRTFAVFVFVLCWVKSAAASPDFPGLLQEQLNMPCVPQCTLCHRDANGGRGTVVTPFGVTMREEGLQGRVPATVPTALNGVVEGQYDSDGDGTGDAEELKEGFNPNQEGNGLLCTQYGCGSSIAPYQGSHPVGVLILMCVFGFLLLRIRLNRARRKEE